MIESALAQLLRDVASGIAEVLGSLGRAALYAFSPIAANLLFNRMNRRAVDENTLDQMLKELASVMGNSARLAGEIDAELKVRQVTVEKLRSEAAAAKEVAALNDEQRRALATILQGEVERAGRKSLVQGAIINAVFFGLGIVATILIGH